VESELIRIKKINRTKKEGDELKKNQIKKKKRE